MSDEVLNLEVWYFKQDTTPIKDDFEQLLDDAKIVVDIDHLGINKVYTIELRYRDENADIDVEGKLAAIYNGKYIVEGYYISDYEDDEDDKKYISIGNSKGPLWCRTHSANIGNNDITCETELDEISRLLNIKNYTPNSIIFVISHTPQFYMNNGINSSCNKRIWRIDLGMSRAFEEQKIITGSKEQNNIIEKLDVSELDKNRAMSILKMNKNININEYDPSSFTKISEGVLSRDYVRNQQATLRENLALTEMFVTHNTNNKYMLKKALPPLTNIIKKYQKLKKEVSKLNKY